MTPKGLLGGAEVWLLSLLDHAPRVEATVVLLEDGPLADQLESRGVRSIVLPTGPAGADVAGAGRSLHALLRREQPDVVLASGIKAATAALPAARLLGIPAAWVRHDDSFADTLGRAAVRLADRTIDVAPPDPDLAHQSQTTFIPPPVLAEPLTAGEAATALRELGVPDDDLLNVGVFARLARYKGIDTMVRALTRPEADGWRLVVAGIDDPGQPGEREHLEALAAELGVTDRIVWLGHVAQAGRLAAGLDAVAVPTRAGVPGYPPGEGFGMTVVESFAAGTPVLADPRTVPAVRMPGYLAGVVEIDAESPDSVAGGLATLADLDTRADLSQAAERCGARHPRPAAFAAAVTGVLAELCARPGAGLADGPAMSVVSTVRNEVAGIGDWLATLVGLLRDDDEIVIVDGGSTDGTLEELHAWSGKDARVRVLEAPGAGISEGRNLGITIAKHDWIACTDAGCVPDPGWLEAMRLGAAEPGVELVTGVYRAGPVEGTAWELALAAVSYPVPEELTRATPLVRGYSALFGRAYDAALPTGRSVAFTREAWRGAGGYPEDLATAEDVLFGKRAIAAGAHPALARDAAVTWDQRPTLRSNLRMFRGYGRGDGQSGDRQLVARDLARAGAYTVAPVLWAAAPRSRPLLAAAGAVYLSLPLRRTIRGRRPLSATALVPAMAAMRDVAKALGCLEGMAQRRALVAAGSGEQPDAGPSPS